MPLHTRLFEWIKDRSLRRGFWLIRAGAAAAATVGEGPEAFFSTLSVAPDDLEASVRDRLPKALADFEADRQAATRPSRHGTTPSGAQRKSPPMNGSHAKRPVAGHSFSGDAVL
jgi:hypothetical protein